ncbi:hypothetical protein FDI95_gp033 [Citrobacter phage CF1 ERZ-2017]|uniref:Uncharacterized protein n=1 Tax=Citrobacter phage CF1 ERZ-2017 TaxID=2267236 RepID=A0A2H4YG40_9CAUD|nr:hypothetical protein FDI95_gp033 [Citrobacter phage CF1 ERZ-2017]AUE22906.1 hypothetical protein Cf1_00033 [Citrobacter phage CF1 ERZ-2017]
MKIKYKIKKKEFHAEVMSLGDDEGSYCGWGRFIETDNQKLINFFNEYLFIEHENFGGSALCIGRYSDVADYYWEYGQTPNNLAKCFDSIIKEAITNTGMYKGFGNEF